MLVKIIYTIEGLLTQLLYKLHFIFSLFAYYTPMKGERKKDSGDAECISLHLSYPKTLHFYLVQISLKACSEQTGTLVRPNLGFAPTKPRL